MPEGDPRRSKGVPKDSKKSEKAPQSDPQARKKVNSLSKLGFVHRRNVLETPKPKVDYHYYTLGVFEILIIFKSNENMLKTMLLEPPGKPVLAWEREARLNE